VSVSGAATTTYTVTGLATGTWYFAVAANASDGSQSAMSNIGSKKLWWEALFEDERCAPICTTSRSQQQCRSVNGYVVAAISSSISL
jgi:hypothetical protein